MLEPLKVVLIGAASPQWGTTLSRDFIMKLSEDRICNSFKPLFMLEDIDAKNLEKARLLAQKIADKTGNRVRIEATLDQKKAVEGARFIITTFAQGTLEAMQNDIEIPQEYGVFQPVGDTISIGGAIRAARNIPAMLRLARDVEALAHPKAWLLNLCNPMSILCRAITRETKVRTIGCCHEIYGGLNFLANILGFPYGQWKNQLKFDLLGINHCGWMQNLQINGQDGFAMLKDALANMKITAKNVRLYNSDHPEWARNNLKIVLFLRYGILPYSGDRHTCEFFTEYMNLSTNKGADYGILLTSVQERLVLWRGNKRLAIKEMLDGKKEIELKVSEEPASEIMATLLLGGTFCDVSNLPYLGDDLPGIPKGTVVERMATYMQDSVVPNQIPHPLPKPLHRHLALHARFIEDVVEASVTGSRSLLVSALKRDPLLSNMKASKIPELASRLLKVHKKHIHPGFFK